MNRLKLIGHKWYVAFITFKSVMQYIFSQTERIAGLKVVIITENELDNLDEHLDDNDVDPKDLN